MAEVDGVATPSPPARPGTAPFPIVGIGASAGGLEAYTQLLQCLPANTGMAFVLILHLDPAHPSLVSDVLAKSSQMPVSQAEEGAHVEPNRVYVIPPRADISIRDGRLTLVARPQNGRGTPHLPVDFFLSALAAERGSHAIGVILSGTASDGTEGLKAIKAADGITLAQDPRSATFPGMPRSAIDAGVVDYCLPTPELAAELVRLSRHPYVISEPLPLPNDDDATFKKIVSVVGSRVGVDLAEYKASTLERRLARRMALRRANDLAGYLALLEAAPDEARALLEDVLIHVSSFFRDPEVFECLKTQVFPEIVRAKPEGVPVRIWVAGCATGEEVYSIGIALLEFLGDSSRPIQIFGSDVSARAIETARAGLYPDSALRDMSDERRRRYFIKGDRGHRIIKSVRDMCVFVEHDLARDPPLSRLDLVSCRNVLIYFGPVLQARVVSRLHYALNQPGYLLIGRSENITGFGELFSVVERGHKIFARSALPSTLRFARHSAAQPAGRQALDHPASDRPPGSGDLAQHLDRLLLTRYVPPGVVVDEKMEILQFRGLTGAYLQAAPGAPQSNLLKMARGGVLSALRATIARAKKEMAPVRSKGVEVEHDGRTRTCDVVVLPITGLPGTRELLYLVLFEEPSAPAAKAIRRAARSAARSEDPRVARLAHELAGTQEYLRSLVDEHNRTADDLGSANEELISGNEELQSMNEALETAKEELESTNEELNTVNDELHSRNQELAQVNSDLVNVLATVEIPILILDMDRRIRRYTPDARRLVNVVPSDVGRPLEDIKLHIDVDDLDQQIAAVIETTNAKESEVQDKAGHWYRMQIRPYRTTDDRIDGAILSLVDIDALKHLVGDAQSARAEAERANRMKDQFLATVSHELRSPLASMLMHAQLLQQGGMEDARIRRAGAAIERGTKMQVRLIEDLLDVSRIVAGRLKLDKKPVDPAESIQAALDGARAQAERKAIEIVKLVPKDSVGRVHGDPLRLQQIVSNLVANAIKFTPDHGRVTLTLDTVDGQARLRVCDTGVGIEPAFLPHLFNRFAQEDSSNSRSFGGLGLGLAIVRNLVELHGGTVRAESAGKGLGSTFSVTLPLMVDQVQSGAARSSPPLAADAAPRHDGQLRDARVLVIDDDRAARDAVCEMLTRRGAKVTVRTSATEALAVVEKLRPDVLVCDIAMPGEDGYAFLRRLRTLGAARGGDTPALALTALAGEEDQRQALAAGFQLFLAKPVDMDRLAEAVAALRAHESGSAPGAEPGSPDRVETR